MDTVNSIVQTKEQAPIPKPEVTKNDETPPVFEAPTTNELYSVSQVKTTSDNDDSPKNLKKAAAPVEKVSNIIDLTKDKDRLKPVSSAAEPDTQILDDEESEFIEDVEAAHGHK